MKTRSFFKQLQQKGQTAVEYMLIISVSVSLCLLFFKKMNQYIVDGPNSYMKTQLRGLEKTFKQDPKFRTIRIPH